MIWIGGGRAEAAEKASWAVIKILRVSDEDFVDAGQRQLKLALLREFLSGNPSEFLVLLHAECLVQMHCTACRTGGSG